MRLQTAGADAIMLYVGESADANMDADTNARVQAATAAIEAALGADLVDLVPSYASVLVIYDPLRCTHTEIARRLRRALADLQTTVAAPARTVVLPVYYGTEVAPDLEALAERATLSTDELIQLHCAREYRVYAIGFAPGFAYLGEVDTRIAAPRLATPRLRVPRGSVGIAERQTAVYPAASPGGWNLIGRCPVPMFNAHTAPHMPVAVGDAVRFEAVSRADYIALGGEFE